MKKGSRVSRIWSDRPIELVEVEGTGCEQDVFAFESAAGLGRIELENALAHQPPGIESVAVSLGVGPSGVPDFSVVRLPEPGPAAAIFTRNRCPGDAVVSGRENVANGRLQLCAVVSKNANVFTPDGAKHVDEIIAALASEFGVEPGDVLLSCTGVIGVPLPMDRILDGIPGLSKSLETGALDGPAEAILTTDPAPKWASAKLGHVVLCGYVKGAGMIEPNMATMLAFLVTDAAASPAFLRGVLRRTADATFNRLSVDGEMSTSDSVLLLANGAAGNPALRGSRSPGARRFESAVREVATSLARDLARDGEGATRLVTVRVEGARSAAEAERGARRIANSLLVKTAIFGGDPNWGRILQTLGAARVHIDLDRAEVRLGGVVVFRRGTSAGPAARRRAAAKHAASEIEILVKLGAGRARAHVWTCDLSYDYVRINAEYTT